MIAPGSAAECCIKRHERDPASPRDGVIDGVPEGEFQRNTPGTEWRRSTTAKFDGDASNLRPRQTRAAATSNSSPSPYARWIATSPARSPAARITAVVAAVQFSTRTTSRASARTYSASARRAARSFEASPSIHCVAGKITPTWHDHCFSTT